MFLVGGWMNGWMDEWVGGKSHFKDCLQQSKIDTDGYFSLNNVGLKEFNKKL